jgi:hypothetical protein
MSKKNYWCYRVDTSNIKYFTSELNEGRLRQGWGWDEAQDLRNFRLDEGAGRNRPMFNKVKKGDILLIPQLPGYFGDADPRFGDIDPPKQVKLQRT